MHIWQKSSITWGTMRGGEKGFLSELPSGPLRASPPLLMLPLNFIFFLHLDSQMTGRVLQPSCFAGYDCAGGISIYGYVGLF